VSNRRIVINHDETLDIVRKQEVTPQIDGFALCGVTTYDGTTPIFKQRENPAVYGVDESKALVRIPERNAFWGRA